MSRRIQRYESSSVVVTFDPSRCIHAAECVRGLPRVFDPEQRPWVRPEAADADRVAEVVTRCPTGALQFERTDGGPGEQTPEANTVEIRPSGPLYVRGQIEVTDPEGEVVFQGTRAALCRCGASTHKPFCDGRHAEAGFSDPGGLAPREPSAAEDDDRTLRIRVTAAGPLIVDGPHELRAAAGSPALDLERAALCRCGASGEKPFCDGSHTGTFEG